MGIASVVPPPNDSKLIRGENRNLFVIHFLEQNKSLCISINCRRFDALKKNLEFEVYGLVLTPNSKSVNLK